MRKKISLLLLAAFTSMPFVSAQNGNLSGERRNAEPDQQTYNEMQKVSPNADKERGTLMYATTLNDYFNQERGWYKIRANEPGNAEKLKTWAPGSQSFLDGLRCGSWGGDTYYAYYVFEYSLGYDYPESFVKVDVETGNLEKIKIFGENDDIRKNWSKYRFYCMAYNPVKDEIYVLGQSVSASKDAVSSIYKVDKTSGDVEKIKDFDFLSFALAVDSDGKLWMQKCVLENKVNVATEMLRMDTDNFNVEETVNIVYDEKNFITFYYGGMAFDYATGDLYWIAKKDGTLNQQLFKVDLKTGEMKSSGVFWGDFVGLHIPYTMPESTEAPSIVTNLSAKPDMTGALKSTLTWTNPSMQWNKSPLTEMTEVRIYKKGSEAPVGTVDAAGKVGQEMSWTDENAAAGINTYYVAPCNASGEGVKDSINVYVGEDVPGKVTNIQIQNSGSSVVLSWDAPAIGMNEGYINAEGMKYTVVRYPDEYVVAKDIVETTVTDENFGGQQSYYYTIQASNTKGAGEIETTENFIAGNAFEVPVTFGFKTELDSKAWKNLGSWEWTAGVQSGDERMVTTIYERPNNWLISPDIKLEAGKTYKVTSTIKTDRGPVGCLYDFKFALGQGKTADDMTKVIYEEKDHVVNTYYFVETFENYVEITESGVYNYGVEVSRITGGDSFSFMGVTVEEVFDTDMQAIELKGFVDAIYNSDNTCTIVVRNKGKNAASNYTVKVARVTEDGEYVVLGEKSDVPSIEPFATAEIEITYVPDQENDMEIVGMVEIAGDGNEDNNVTEKYSLVVLPEGLVGFNRLIKDESALGFDTRVPVSFFTDQSMTQTIYHADEINADGDSWIQRIAYEYTGNDITSVLGPVAVKIYMCHTDKEVYANEKDDIPLDEMQQVYEGEITINPGVNVMSFILSEEFEYTKGKNLCIAVVKNGLVGNDYPALFHIFSTDFEVTRTIVQDNMTLNYWQIPVLQLALKEKVGVEKNVTIGGSAIWYNASESSLNFSDSSVKDVYVYDITGKLAGTYQLAEGAASLPVRLSEGLYVIRTVNAEGVANTAKISVLK